MRLAELLRLTAIGIALMCWLDPPLVVAPQPPVIVDVALLHSERDGMPAAGSGTATVGQRVREAGLAIAAALGAAGDVRVHDPRPNGPLSCDAQRPCVLVGGATASARVPADRRGPTFLLRVGEPLAPNVTVTGLSVPATHTASTGDAVVGLRGDGVNGRDTRVRLLDGSAVVGEAVHRWTNDGDASVEVPWWPVAAGTRTLVARAILDAGAEETGLDNEARVTVAVADGPWPVVVFERRPSWAATFARRALEGDPRFALDARTDVAPGITARSSASAVGLDEGRLDRARVILVGAPEALGVDDVDRLDAFVRRRGGAVVLAPDRRFTGPVARLLPQAWRQQDDALPSEAGSLRAREWLVAEDLSGFDEVVATSQHGPAVVATPVGRGRVVVVGALDAWRYRASGNQFDRFWRDLVTRLASAAGAAVEVTVDRRAAAPGDELQVRLEARSVRSLPSRRVTARLECGEGAGVTVRLWPDHAPAAFVGRARVPSGTSRCSVVGEMAELGDARADVVITGEPPEAVAADVARTEAVVAETGGLIVSDRELARLTDALRALASDIRTPEARYPMRSPWWLLLLAGCLGGEWWLRRRTGLR